VANRPYRLVSRALAHARLSTRTPHPTGGVSQLPSPGQPLWARPRWSRTPLKAKALDVAKNAVVLTLAADARPLAQETSIELEWVDHLGLVRRHGRIDRTRDDGSGVLEVKVEAPAILIQRREHLRAPVVRHVTATVSGPSPQIAHGTTLNLGGGGALLSLPLAEPVFPLLELLVDLPDRPLSVRAEVVRREAEDRLAVRFLDIDPEDEERVTAFVFAHLEEAKPAMPQRPRPRPPSQTDAFL
jgi:c-di-GMP-binding flagellar brake protein YcgR